MFYLYIAYVAMAIHVCCRCVFQIFQLFHLDVACFHLDISYVVAAIHVCCKCIFQMFLLFQTYVASVLSRYCISCGSYIHMLQTYVSIVSHCFSILQQVLHPTRSDSRASTRCTRHPCTTRPGPLQWSMQPSQHMCIRVVLPPSLSHWGTGAVLSRTRVCAL
jgi:hypothetical protein